MTAEQLQQLLASMQAQIDQLEQDLKTEKAINEALWQQKSMAAFSAAVKPSLSAAFWRQNGQDDCQQVCPLIGHLL